MRRKRSRSSWLRTVLAGLLFISPVVPLIAEEGDGMTFRGLVPSYDAYQYGKNAARTELKFPHVTSTGFFVGLSLPFMIGGSAAGMYHVTGKNGVCALIMGLSSPVLWVWGGHKLIQRTEIPVPEFYRDKVTEEGWNSFSRGYRDVAQEKKDTQYANGVLIGTGVSMGISLCVVYMIASAFKGFAGD